MRNPINLFFNDIQIPDWIMVTSIEQDILPKLEVTKRRSIFHSKIVKINFTVRQKCLLDQYKIDELIRWVRGDNFKESKLVLPNSEDSYYLAKLKSNINSIQNSVITGKGSIEFILFYPNRIEFMENKIPLLNANEINYIGTANTYPVIEFDITSECEELKVSIENSEYNNYFRLKHHFNKGQKVIIDMKTKKVTVNNEVKMQIFTLDSRFHMITEGINKYTLKLGNADVNIIYQHEYL